MKPPSLSCLCMNVFPHLSFSILINSSPYGFSSASRGLRQSDSISPALFTTYFDVLSRLLTRAKMHGVLHGIKISRESPPESHLMFADDLSIFCRAIKEEAEVVDDCLQTFSKWSGQIVSNSKSSIHYSRNVSQSLKGELGHILKMDKCKHDTKYLCTPFCRVNPRGLLFLKSLKSLSPTLVGER